MDTHVATPQRVCAIAADFHLTADDELLQHRVVKSLVNRISGIGANGVPIKDKKESQQH